MVHQKYSLFHSEGKEEALKAWHAPYAELFRGCRRVLDLGCGPGLFLGLLKQRGVGALGIDCDPDMVVACQEQGLEATLADVRELHKFGNCDGIHASHIIEHLSGTEAIKFLEDCVHALEPGGMLVVRTPNWQNEVVRRVGFWLDPTHVRPYPLETLERILTDLGLRITQKGHEDTGWNDAYIVVQKLKAPLISAEALSRAPAQYAVLWEGSQFVSHSLALVNRELCLGLIKSGQVELGLIPYEGPLNPGDADPRLAELATRINRCLTRPADFHIAHRWPPRFDPPAEGHWIIMQPWEYGTLPKAWPEPLEKLVDEVWVPSSFTRRCYIESGISPDKVTVIPLGINPDLFHPQAPPLKLETEKSFRFLFVGGTIWRKGVDLLLNAYVAAFRRRDDVCLVIKDMGPATAELYRGQTCAQSIRQLQADPQAPEILYLPVTLSEPEMAGLYSACHCLAHPYRGEAFALPVAEAMACGLPVILTRGGACDDFCPEGLGYWLPAQRIEARVAGVETVAPAWVLEPDPRVLMACLRHAFSEQSEAKARGRLGSDHIRHNFTWNNSVQRVLERMAALKDRPVLRNTGSAKHTSKPAPGPPEEPPKPEGLLLEALALERGGDLAGALRKYEAALARHGNRHDILLQIGRLRLQLDQIDLAIEGLRRAVEAGGGALAHAYLGVAYLSKGTLDQAEDNLLKALALDEKLVPVQRSLGDVYFCQERYLEAAALFHRVARSSQASVDDLMALANCYFKAGLYDAARLGYEETLKLVPDHQIARENLGVTLALIGQDTSGA